MRKFSLSKRQWLIIMRVTILKFVFFIISSSSVLYANRSSAQEILDRPVSVELRNVSLKAALTNLETAAKIQFSYSRNIINLDQTVTCIARSETLARVLHRLFRPLAIDYQVVNQQILLYQSKNRRTRDQPSDNISFSPTETGIAYAALQGRVVSASTGQGLADVSVVVKNSNIGTVTDRNGAFRLEVPNANAVLIISYVGHITQEVAVSDQAFLEIRLVQDIQSQDEVVVVGYGTQRARNVTGAVARVGAKEIKQVAVVSADQALIGRVAGLQVSQNSGEPGGEISVRIRGISSITSGSDPLIVIDGIPMSVNLRAINPNDIETIDVLKDAAAAAIYGSRASAGVILITTKRGKAGRVTVSLDAFTGFQEVARTIPLLNGPEFAQLANENLANAGQPTNPAWDNPQSLPTTDWQDAIFRTAPMHNYNVAVSGGNEKARTYVSFGYTKQDGIIARSTYERYTSRINMDFDVSSKLKLGVNINFNFDKNRNPTTQSTDAGVLTGTPNGVLQALPTDPIYTDVEGPLGDHLYGFRGYAMRANTRPSQWYVTINPVWRNDYYTEITRSENTQLLTNAFAELELIKGLKFKTILGYNINNSLGYYGGPYKLPAEIDPQSNQSFQQNWSRDNQWNWVNTLSYAKDIGAHNFTVLVGADALKGRGGAIQGNGSGQPENQQSLSATTGQQRVSGSDYIPFSLFSILGRITYNYDEKYLLSFNVRRDGSSKFQEENRYGTFPSVSAGWRISQENFMRSAEFIDELKIRASYGSVGNQNIPDLRYLSTYTNMGGRFGYSLGNPTALVLGIQPGVLGNPLISWEKNTERNFGIDATLFRGMFNLTFDYYKKELTDLLGTVPTPFYSTPFNGSFLANAFSMENKGIEVSVGFNKSIGEVQFNASANFTTIQNEVTSLIPGNTSGFLFQSISMINAGAYNDGGAQTRTMVGETVGNFWGYIFDGIIQNQAELDASGMQGLNAQIGDKRFKDINGRNDKGDLTGQPDGKITEDDKTIIGNGIPGYIYGFTIGAEFRGFDFNALFNGQGDVQIANMTKAVMYHMHFFNGPGLNNGHKDLLNSWRGEGTSNTLPRNAYNAPTSNRFFATDYIENGAFLRLRNVQLGYTLPSRLSDKAGMSRARIYVSAQNLFTVTDYSGYDPEVGSATIGTRVQTAGVDFGRYPAARMFTVGINVQF
jgi:TonB-dependent starch-binding outer membrane protein SusC